MRRLYPLAFSPCGWLPPLCELMITRGSQLHGMHMVAIHTLYQQSVVAAEGMQAVS
jgi:hypothetical protein